MIDLDEIVKFPDGSLTREEVQELVTEIERLRVALVAEVEIAATSEANLRVIRTNYKLLIENARLRAALAEISDCARSLTGYCQWCDARPERTHEPGCPARIARAALAP
jgi:hypothetical protein